MSETRAFESRQALERGVTLIEASAGTGKTYTITSLVVRLIVEQGLSIDQVLVVTFTEAATAELRERVRQRLVAVLRTLRGESLQEADPLGEELAESLQRRGGEARLEAERRLRDALHGFDGAAISTIHGFCQRVLQEHAFESGVPFGAELITDETPLIQEIVRDFWTGELHHASPELVQFLWSSSWAPSHLRLSLDKLEGLAQLFCTHRGMRVLPKEVPAVDDVPELERWRDRVRRLAELFRVERDIAGQLLDAAPLHAVFAKRIPEAFESVGTWLERPTPTPATMPPLLERLTSPAIAKKTRKGGAPPQHALFDECARVYEETRALHQSYEARAFELLLRFEGELRAELTRKKEAAAQLSFDDLLHVVARALRGARGESLARELSERYRAVLIDEFQDTDPVQYEIFDRVFARESGWLFLIGDPKQAIYSFRGADIFAYGRAVVAAGENRFTLTKNWRSDEPLVRAFEHLFTRLSRPFSMPDIEFQHVEAHHLDARLTGEPRRAPLLLRFADVTAEPWNGLVAGNRKKMPRIRRRALADAIPTIVAGEIESLIRQEYMLEEQKLSPEHIAILVRKNDQARQLQRALRERGIPSVLQGAANVFETTEAGELRDLLAAVADPSSSRRVKVALATDLLGFRAEHLEAFESDEASWERQIEWFRVLNRRWVDHGFIRMFRRIVEGVGFSEKILSALDGERRMTNLLHLGELLHRREGEERLGVTGLLRWFDVQLSGAPDAGEDTALRLESDQPSVQLVTIHRAKGLQYPIVFCPYLWESLSLHQLDSLYPRFHDGEHDDVLTIDLGSDRRGEALSQATYEARAEGLRLLYVALTRARHHCVVYTGVVDGIDTSPLGYLLHGPVDCGPGPGGMSAAESSIKVKTRDALSQDLDSLAAMSGGTIAVERLEPPPSRPPLSRPSPGPRLEVRRPRRRVSQHWRRTSFSGLISRDPWVVVEEAAPDEPELDEQNSLDGAPVTDSPTSTTAVEDEVVLLDEWVRGTEAGSCLHSVLEHADFTGQKSELRPIVERELARYGFEPEKWAELLTAGLLDVFQTPLTTASASDALRLEQIGRSDRLDELEFLLPIRSTESNPSFAPARLAELFRKQGPATMPSDYPEQVAQLGFEALKGRLTGFIDLVFRHNQRWYVIDYKSNHLGSTYGAYEEGLLPEAMAEHHYYIQYHFYLFALHRYLRWRQPDYDYERHFGGVFYLFLRGMSPRKGGRFGVFRDRPTVGMVQALDELFEGGTR